MRAISIWLLLATLNGLGACTGGSRGDTENAIEPLVVDESVTVNHFLRFINTQSALAAGDYIVVAATANVGESDVYTLTVNYDNGMSETFTGEWTASGGMDPANNANPRHQISLQIAGGIKLSLSSTVDNYLYLLRNEHIVAENDDSEGGTDALLRLENSQINAETYARAYYRAVDPNDERASLSEWKTINGFDSGEDHHITFRDRIDLGYGRDMYSRVGADGSLAFYVDNYVVQLGQGDVTSYGPLGLDAALAADQSFYIGSNAIEFSPIDATDPDSDKVVKLFSFNPPNSAGVQLRKLATDMDGRGEKFLPTVCMVCHGAQTYPLNPDGTFPEVTLRTTKMNALDPGHFTFSNQAGFTEADLQRDLKEMNRSVHGTYLEIGAQDDTTRGKWSAGFALDIDAGAYGGDFSSDSYDQDYVPPGWVQNVNRPDGVEQLYSEVVKLHCIACHSLLGSNTGENVTVQINDERVSLANAINFSSYEKFISYEDRIIELVYRRGRMPLSLLNFNEFWSDSVTAPTLLSTFLPGFDAFDGDGKISKPQVPVAITGGDRTSTSPVNLSAAASFLADSFSWRLVSSPTEAIAELSSTEGATTVLLADIDGVYVVELTASNSANLTDVQQVTITIDSLLNPAPDELTFVGDIIPILSSCANCHRNGGPFAGIPVSFDANDARVYLAVRERIDFTDTQSSLLLLKPTQVQHGGRVQINRGTVQGEQKYQTLLNWITNGAPCGDDPLICDLGS